MSSSEQREQHRLSTDDIVTALAVILAHLNDEGGGIHPNPANGKLQVQFHDLPESFGAILHELCKKSYSYSVHGGWEIPPKLVLISRDYFEPHEDDPVQLCEEGPRREYSGAIPVDEVEPLDRLRVTFQESEQDLVDGSMSFHDPETVEMTVIGVEDTHFRAVGDGKVFAVPAGENKKSIRGRSISDTGSYGMIGYRRSVELVPRTLET